MTPDIDPCRTEKQSIEVEAVIELESEIFSQMLNTNRLDAESRARN